MKPRAHPHDDEAVGPDEELYAAGSLVPREDCEERQVGAKGLVLPGLHPQHPCAAGVVALAHEVVLTRLVPPELAYPLVHRAEELRNRRAGGCTVRSPDCHATQSRAAERLSCR
jgi:hypothetical protein